MAKLSYRKAVEKARKAQDKAVDAIYATAPNNTTKFYDCLTNAPLALKDAYYTAQRELIAAEQAAIDAGRAYRASFGMLTFYR